MNRRQALQAAAAAATGALPLRAEGASRPQLLRRPYQPSDGGEEREYFLYVPSGFHSEPGRRWPVILFLHGNGERGDGRDDLNLTMAHGPVMEAWVQARDLPFLIIQPQLPLYGRELSRREVPMRGPDGSVPQRGYGSRSEEPMRRADSDAAPRFTLPEGWDSIQDDLLAMVDSTIEDFRGDAERVYLTGLSYGGYGSWHMAIEHTDRWAAVAPICGAAEPGKVQAIADAKLPTWVFQGGRDTVIRPEWVLATAKALEAAGHPEVRMTVHEDLSHNVWTRVYEGWDLYGWFLRQRRDSS